MKNILFVLSFLLLVGCTAQKSTQDFSKISYTYQGAALAPQYHRSYTIEIDENAAKLSIRDYAKTLKNETVALTDAQWKNLLTLGQKLPNNASSIANGAVGTSTIVIKILENNGNTKQITFDSMNDPTGDIKAFNDSVKALFPNLSQLIQSTIQN